MWGTKLCLLLLLGTNTLAQQDVGGLEEQSPVCFLAKRYRNFRRFVYNYEAEAVNSVNGASNAKSGPRVSCTVEIDVPQTCRFILRTTDCSLTEVSGVDDGGNPVYRPAAGAEDFKAAMAKNTLKVAVEGRADVKLFPEDDEPVNILNVKRGIISALMVPEKEQEETKDMPTVHGVCSSDFAVNPALDTATEVTVSRDLSKCDGFVARRQNTSPLALISGMNYPLSKLISSTQTCNYKFDNQKKHMTSGSCTEKHIFLPFSHKREFGISAVVSQTVTLRETSKINDRIFDHNEASFKPLPMEAAEDKSPVQTKDAVIATLQKLSTLSETNEREERASLFHKLVSELRGLNVDVLGSNIEEMMSISVALTQQALIQCGTPECTSGMLKILRNFDQAAYEVDAFVYALGMMSNPSRMMVQDLLEMARYKQSRPIMYALSNAARRLYKSEGVTPEITAVYEYMASLLGADCAGEKDLTFLTLRVVGNMGDAMEAADPEIKNTLLKCMRQPVTTLSVQLAAIQAFRRMSLTDEVRTNLQRVSQYAKGAVQKRLAAYLILMRDPQDSDFEMVKKLLTQERNTQIKAFVSSHVYNIITSTEAETKKLGERILYALKNTDIFTHDDYTTKSRNYKLGVAHENSEASIQGNVIFDPSNQLPREVLLETTLKAFGYSLDIWEVGMEGKGFEPTIEALFGKNGFFPDAVLKTLYWADGKMPPEVKQVLEKWVVSSKPGKPNVPENLVAEIGRNFNTLLNNLQSQESPEAMAYLKIMGAELGYIKGNDLKFIADIAINNAKTFMHHAMGSLNGFPNFDAEMFAHYIFMDNKFILPTASGLPMTFALSGTFAPGAKGGLHISPNKKEVVFSPSIGVEFMTQMGVHFPGSVASAVEMHTNIFHESSLNAKITMEQNELKLSMPAPQGTTKLFRIRNKVVIAGAEQATELPHRHAEEKCSPLFSGINYCTKKLRADARDENAAPYFPLNGETMFAIDIKPTKDVSEYTASIAYKLLSEGKEGRHKVDSLKMTLRAEGVKPTEATATMKYNRNRNVFTTQIQIPDIDVEAGVKIGMTDSSAKGKSLTIELSNKNVPQLSLTGRAKLQAMDDGLLQVQLLVPSLKVDATLGATVTKAGGLTMQIKSDVKLPEMSSVQAVTFKYGEEEAEAYLTSNVNADTKIPVHYAEALQSWLGRLAEDLLEKKVVQTDMKLRHIVNKGIEASNIWIDKISPDCPYMKKLKDVVGNLEMPSVPEILFMNFESKLRYQFNQNRFTMTVPLPLGGKSSEELRIPPVVSVPRISVPQLGLEVAPREIPIPRFTVPSEKDLTLPLMGLLEVSAKVNSNYYDWEGLITAGNNTADSPEYVAKFSVMAESPIKLLSFSTEGTTKITDTEKETIDVTLEGSLKHMLINTGVSVLESFSVTDNVLTTGLYKIHANSPPVGLDSSLTITTQFTLDSDTFFGDINTDGSIAIGSEVSTTSYLSTFSVKPASKEAKLDSSLMVKCDPMKLSHKVKASYESDVLLFESTTSMDSALVQHTTKINLNYNDVKLTTQSDSVTKALGRRINNQMAFSMSEGQASLRIENQAEDTQNRVFSLLTGTVNPSGLEINADASIKILSSLASHKATLSLNTNGLTTSCTTTAQHSPLTFENIFHGGIGASGATLSLKTKGTVRDNKAELNVEGKLSTTEVYLNSMYDGSLFDISGRNRVNLRLNENGLVFSNNLVGSFREMRTENTHSLSLTLRSFTLQTKTDNYLDKSNSYMHDITVKMEDFAASAMVKNELKVMAVNFENDAQFKAEPYNVELAGTLKGSFSEEELMHIYEIKFADFVLSAKCNTNGKLLGSHVTHNTDMEVNGLTIKFSNVANFNSPYLRVDSTVKTSAAPFTLNVDAIFNSNGEVYLFGKHSGELYSKFLLKAEPTEFAQSFEHRASSSHELTDRPTVKTNMNNKLHSLISLAEQMVTLDMASTVNEHTFTQMLSAKNNAERIGVELKGKVSTPLFSEAKEDYTISGFVKYDKNSDSHFIEIPFVEHLPAVIENVKSTMIKLMDHSIEMLKDINTRYEISAKFQAKITELKETIDSFDFGLFVQDLKGFITPVEKFITKLTAQLPTDKVIHLLKSIKDAVIVEMRKYNIPTRFNVVYNKIEEFLSSYEIEKIIGAIMDEVVQIMKQYQIREKLQQTFEALKSLDLQPLFDKFVVPAKELVNELYSFDFKLFIDDVKDFFSRMIQKIKSFDYDTLAVELKDKVAEMSKIPCFGKLYGEFKVSSPHYSFSTQAELENTTTTAAMPEFKVSLNSRADSTLKALDFTADASARFAAPETGRLIISESINVQQSSFAVDHKGTMNLYGLSAQASAETTAKATTELYAAELVNNALFTLENGVSAKMDTAYKHDLKFPPLNTYSEITIDQKTIFGIEDAKIQLTFNNLANEKYRIWDFSDEMNHKSDIKVEMDLQNTKVTFTADTSSGLLKVEESFDADISIFRHIQIDAKVKTDTPFMKNSVAELKLLAKAEDMKIDFTAFHNAELAGNIRGTLSSSVSALISATELTFDSKNKGNAKVVLPFKLSGNVNLQNDVTFTLNSEIHKASWTGLVKFNQYKYSHLISLDNAESEINIQSQIYAEADLEVLKEPFNIPEITLPFVGMRTQRVEGFSLWENTGLNNILTTTQQTLDISSKLKYIKNPEMMTIDINLDPVIRAINVNTRALHKKMLIGKDKAATILASSYNKAMSEYEKYSIELPKTIVVPAYKVPVMNVEMSSFTVPLPDVTLVTMPSLHIPSALTKLTVPKITLPKVQSIKIPVMGDLTYEFSMKTEMITLKTDASILNQDGIKVRFDASSSSGCEILTGKIEGNTNVNTVGEFKMASLFSVKHSMLVGNHESTIILGYENVDTSVSNSAKVTLPSLTMEIKQEIKGNPVDGLVVSMSTPSAGLLGVQMQTKRPAQMKARLYGRYPSQPTTDINILGLKMSVMDSEKLNLQTTWNMEMPYEIMLGVKNQVPEAVEMVSDCAVKMYNKISRHVRSLKGLFEKFRIQGKAIFEKAVENLAAVSSSDFIMSVTDKTIVILRESQKKAQLVLDAVITFLKQTKFQIPGYERRLSGLEVYQEFSTFVADVSEEAVEKLPEYFVSIFASVFDFAKAIEFTIPGSNRIITGEELFDDLVVALRKIQKQLIANVRKLGDIQLDDIIKKFSEFMQFVVEQSEKILQTLKTPNVENISSFVMDAYRDAISSNFLAKVARQVNEVHIIIREYIKSVINKIYSIMADVSTEQLRADIQSWIDLSVKRINAFHNTVIRTLKEKSKDVEPYVRVSDRQIEVDIPLPFVARFNYSTEKPKPIEKCLN
ncbi:apolipoprotein B-100 isoform X1 [Fundulus heteroclitus]|uniref:apolipoprotein B-100 isoform X1 n=1 Tax=Fundulus heteroclitus TaxID=8078 RepID=UPI00165CAED4|nr:apolipoprotein B-100 isoform X1 [Fundulus heteroclitus]